VINTTVIGESDSYRKAMERQSEIGSICLRNGRAGIDLHTWKVEQGWAGAKISNVKLSGFQNATCRNAASIKYDSQVRNIASERRTPFSFNRLLTFLLHWRMFPLLF
jgi:hypothetical protein